MVLTLNNQKTLLKNISVDKNSFSFDLSPLCNICMETLNILEKHNIVFKESLIHSIVHNDLSQPTHLFDLYKNGIRVGVFVIHGNTKKNSNKITIIGLEEPLEGEQGNEWNIKLEQDVVEMANHLGNAVNNH